MHSRILAAAVAAVVSLAVVACRSSDPSSSATPAPTSATAPSPTSLTSPPAAPAGESAAIPRTPGEEEPLEALPTLADVAEALELEVTPERVALGRQLFHDTRLSKDMTVSCASCHDLRFGGVDRTPTAVGIYGQVGPVNTPTVFNAALGIAQFWDGRAKTLADQAAGPPQAAGEMGSNFQEITSRLQQDKAMVADFARAFPEQVRGAGDVTTERVLEAIATFEATLLTPGSRFDRWLGGEHEVLTDDELAGYALFKQVGCVQCHYGPAVGGKAFQKLGHKRDFFSTRQLSHADNGRFNVTNDERDRHSFKVPSLRNVELTAPYLHDGSVASLRETVRVMAHYQLGTEIDDVQTDRIVAFLRTLTGTYEGRPLQAQPAR
jgi:cytochrome c peroxidase